MNKPRTGHRYRLSVDPGENAGVAVWRSSTWSTLCRPAAYAVYTPQIAGQYHVKCEDVYTRLWGFLDRYRPISHVYVEWPAVWIDGGSGYEAAMEGSVVKLAYSVGWVHALALALNATFVPVQIREWKGTLPKRVVTDRIQEMIGVRYPDHAGDAVGIGLHCKGFRLADD
jgi:hypothetical protein